MVGSSYAYTRGNYIRVASLDGADDRRLRRGVSPVWSPNGRRIAYASRKGVWLINARTGERLRRVASGSPVDWSPDGRWLLCVRYGGSFRKSDLYAVRANGRGSPQRLTWTRGSESDAAFSPDGRQIVFTMLARVSEYTLQRSVWTMNRDGTEKKRIWEESPYVDDDENRVTESGVTLSWQPSAANNRAWLPRHKPTGLTKAPRGDAAE